MKRRDGEVHARLSFGPGSIDHAGPGVVGLGDLMQGQVRDFQVIREGTHAARLMRRSPVHWSCLRRQVSMAPPSMHATRLARHAATITSSCGATATCFHHSGYSRRQARIAGWVAAPDG